MAKMNSKTRNILIIVGLVVVLSVAGIIIWQVTSKKPVEQPTEVAQTTKKRRISVPSNMIPVSQRPYTELLPFDQSGRNLRIQVDNLPLSAGPAEYLIEYSVGKTTAKSAAGKEIKVPEAENVTGIQGSMGELALTSFPSTAELLLGTCSAGGACTHHSGLSTGTLTITYQSADPYATSQKFNYFEKYDKEAATEDGNFVLISDVLKKNENFVIINSAGLPSGLTGEVVVIADPSGDPGATIPFAYQPSFTTKPTAGTVTVAFNYEGNGAEGAQIMAYDQTTKTWTPLETTVTNGQLTATDTKVSDIYALVGSSSLAPGDVMGDNPASPTAE